MPSNLKWKLKPSKYRATATIIDGIKFGSKKEAAHYQQLKLAKKNGDLLFFLRQTPFHLPGNIVYRADFIEFWANGEIRIVDVKGFKTSLYILKKKQVEAIYPIIIDEI